MGTFLSSYMMVLVTGLLVLAMFWIRDSNRGNERYFSPLRWVGFGFLVLFVIQPFNHLYFDQVTMDVIDPDVFDPMAFACILSAGGFICGWILAPHERIGVRGGRDMRQRSGSSPYVASTLGLAVLLLIGAASAGWMVVSYHGMETFIGSTEQAVTVMGVWFNIFSWLFSSLMVFGLLGLCSTKTWRSWSFLISALALLLFALLSLKLGARSRILLPLLGGLAILAARIAPERFRVLAAILAAFAIIFVFIFGLIRYEFTYSTDYDVALSQIGNTFDSVYHAFFMSGDFDAFENGMQVLRAVPDQHDFLYGQTLLSVLYNPIPRPLWLEKPSFVLQAVLKTSSYGRGGSELENFACSFPAELYANFGWAGVVIGMILLGNVSARIYDHFANSPHRNLALMYLSLYSSSLVLLLRGSFHVVVTAYLGILFWFWLYNFMPRVLLRRRQEHLWTVGADVGEANEAHNTGFRQSLRNIRTNYSTDL
jgi:oligosaccharide repeat unit polymerase